MYNRRDFLKYFGLAGITLFISFLGFKKYRAKLTKEIPGKISGANFKTGHLLRLLSKEIPKTIRSIDTIVVGGGVSGLSAGWYFKKKKYKDFLIFEMDTEVGGNSRAGANTTSKYPYGAHYVPLPGIEATYVRELFEEVGIIVGYKNHLPIYNEFYLCSDPNERLYFQGQWQEGLIPIRGTQETDKRQFKAFFSFIESMKQKKGRDGKFAFTIPMEFSSQDPELLSLDKVSMYDFLIAKEWNSKYLHWYVEYCCRDDFGVSHEKVSAWAGFHYFASRGAKAANADPQTVLTWPEGNEFLTSKLRKLTEDQIKTNILVYHIEQNKDQTYLVDVRDTTDDSLIRYRTKNLIFAAPRFIAKKIIKGYEATISDALDFSPWLVANITLKSKPNGTGATLSWDNVSFYSLSLGYIVANHQDLTTNREQIVITYYLPLDRGDLKTERQMAYQRNFSDWLEILLPDLEKIHPGITSEILEVDLWIWGHGMVSPGIDYLWSEKRKRMLSTFQGIEFAHSDMSGISIFEEAQYRGCEAAKKILNRKS